MELLTAVEHPPAERLRIARLLGDVAARGVASLGDTGARVTVVLREVVADVEEPRPAVAEVRLSLGRLLLQLGEFDGAADEIEEATGGLEGSPVGAAKAAISLAWPRGHRWPAERHRTWMVRATALTEAVPPGLDRTWLEVDRAGVMLMLGDEDGWSVAEQLRPHAHSTEEQRHIARLLLNMGHVAIAWGRDEQAQALPRGGGRDDGRHRLPPAAELRAADPGLPGLASRRLVGAGGAHPRPRRRGRHASRGEARGGADPGAPRASPVVGVPRASASCSACTRSWYAAASPTPSPDRRRRSAASTSRRATYSKPST